LPFGNLKEPYHHNLWILSKIPYLDIEIAWDSLRVSFNILEGGLGNSRNVVLEDFEDLKIAYLYNHLEFVKLANCKKTG
jgi:hypothetical protein